MSKQNLNYLLNELEKMGYLIRVADPEDGRAKLVQVTEEGRTAMLKGLSVFKELEVELAEKIENSRMSELKAGLEQIVELLESD